MSPDLERLNEIWTRAWLEKDVALVEKLMGDDYVYIAPNGQVQDRQAILNVIKSPTYGLTSSVQTELVIKTIADDVVALVRRSQSEGAFEGMSFKEDHRCTTVCARRGTEWRIVLEHCTVNTQ